jgi:hypothetical protein
MIEIRFRGGPGEWLFQYAFGRLLAERWGVSMKSAQLPGMPRAEPVLNGRTFFGPMEVFSGSACELLSTGSLIRPRDLLDPFPARLIIHGWFLRTEYYAESLERLRDWFRQDVTESRGTAVCLRTRPPEAWADPGAHAGKSTGWGQTTSLLAEIEPLVASANAGPLTVFADGPPPMEFTKSLHPYGCDGAWYPLDTVASFRKLRSFRYICASAHHPFEWWAAFLNPSMHAWFYDPYLGGCASGRCTWIGGRPLGRPDLRLSDSRFHYGPNK